MNSLTITFLQEILDISSWSAPHSEHTSGSHSRTARKHGHCLVVHCALHLDKCSFKLLVNIGGGLESELAWKPVGLNWFACSLETGLIIYTAAWILFSFVLFICRQKNPLSVSVYLDKETSLNLFTSSLKTGLDVFL